MTSGKRIFIVTCVDHRLYEKEFECCVPEGPYFFTFVGGAMGAIKHFGKLVDDIEALQAIKGSFDEAIIADHTNCAAHGGNEDKEDHYVLMDRLADMLNQKYPELKVQRCLINLGDKQLESVSERKMATAV